MTKHVVDQHCPICLETFLQHVHCTFASCRFFVTTCPKCDREQAVREFVDDHEADCDHRTPASTVQQTTRKAA